MAINDDILVERLVPKVLSAIRSKSKPVESLNVTADLTGITSLPGYDTTGGQYRKVLVAIEALRKPAIDAANVAQNATAAANAAAERANDTEERVARNEEQRLADEALRIENEQNRVAAEKNRVSVEAERVSEFARLAEESEAATASANDTADHPTYIGLDNYVYRWNKQSQTYDKTDIYVRGEAFSIKRVYKSVVEMLEDRSTSFKEGDFCLIDTGDVENPDNAKLYVRSAVGAWDFLVDMSGAIGFTGKTPQILVGDISIGSGKHSVSVTLSEDGVDSDGNPKYRFNFVIPCLAYEDFTVEQIEELQRPATEAKEQVLATEAQIKSNEDIRLSNEASRVEVETSRVKAEDIRKENEVVRQSNEDTRLVNEAFRVEVEASRVEAEDVRKENEVTRQSNEDTRLANESSREEAELSRHQTQQEMMALNQELAEHPPVVNSDDYWEVWNAVTKQYVNTGVVARGKRPVIRDGIWWLWNDSTNDYVSSGWAVNSDFQLTKDGIEGVFHGDITSHTHSHLRYEAKVYEELPDLASLVSWSDELGEHAFLLGNDIYVRNDAEPTGYANYKLAPSINGPVWIRIPQVADGWQIVLVKK